MTSEQTTPTPWPVPGVAAQTALATSMAASPGVYAVLLGSGISSSAGIKTGFQVVRDLVRTIAAAQGADLGSHADRPELWWHEQTGAEPRYDDLLAELASTDLDRRALLRRYFNAASAEPTQAHRELGRLVADGRVRVVITTNFDQLAEQAIREAGLAPQVIADVAGIRGMIPLQHAEATVLKPHGDFANTPLRNTPEELDFYEDEWVALLGRVFNEYGLIVVGWSAAWDTALARTLRQTESRRYPTFWAHRGPLTDQAAHLTVVRQAHRLAIDGADALFADLQSRLDRIEAAAARRGPFRFTSHLLLPPDSSPPTGWAVSPLLKITVAATLTGLKVDQLDLIRTRDRARLVSELSASSLTRSLTRLRDTQPAADAAQGMVTNASTTVPEGDWAWHGIPGFHQSASSAGYRLGGTAQSGVGALCRIALPPSLHGGDAATVIVDIAISSSAKLSPTTLGEQLQSAIELVAITIPDVLEPLLPSSAGVSRLDIRLAADADNGLGFHRPNTLQEPVDWSSLGSPTRSLGQFMGVGITINQLVAVGDMTDLVVGALERMTVEAGLEDRDDGFNALRHDLAEVAAHQTEQE